MNTTMQELAASPFNLDAARLFEPRPILLADDALHLLGFSIVEADEAVAEVEASQVPRLDDDTPVFTVRTSKGGSLRRQLELHAVNFTRNASHRTESSTLPQDMLAALATITAVEQSRLLDGQAISGLEIIFDERTYWGFERAGGGVTTVSATPECLDHGLVTFAD